MKIVSFNQMKNHSAKHFKHLKRNVSQLRTNKLPKKQMLDVETKLNNVLGIGDDF
jgi:hypothetical protein